MATELELKLMVHPANFSMAADFFDQWCKKAPNCHRQATLNLMNGYFDTSDNLLMQAGIALRIRAVNQRFIQTLKTRGTSRIGMHERGEWEWEISQDRLDFGLLEAQMLPESLQDLHWVERVGQVFRTDFVRQVWSIQLDSTKIEAVCDQGEVTSPYGKDGICEIELELQTGDEQGLYDLAFQLARQVPVQVSTVSKAQKGVRLKTPEIELPKLPLVSSSKIDMAVYWYEVWLTYWEALLHRRDISLLDKVCQAMSQLAQCLPTARRQSLLLAESSIQVATQTVVQTAIQTIAQADVDARLMALAQQKTIGLSMLEIGRWLNQQH